MKKFLLFFVCMFFVIGNVFAEDITIAMVPKGLDNPFFEPIKEAAEKEALKQGVKLIWVGPSETDTQGQIVTIKSLIKKNVDGIAVSANDANALNDVIAEAVSNGIKVITFDSDAKDSERLFYVGGDNVALAKKCAQELAKIVKKNAKVALISGAPTAQNLNERIQGFSEGAKEEGLEIKTTLYCYDNIDKAASLVESYTKSTPDLDAWCFFGSWPLRTPVENMVNLKRFSKKGGKAVAFYLPVPQGVPYIETGAVSVAFRFNVPNMGKLAVKALTDVIKNNATYPEIVDVGADRIDINNISEYK